MAGGNITEYLPSRFNYLDCGIEMTVSHPHRLLLPNITCVIIDEGNSDTIMYLTKVLR